MFSSFRQPLFDAFCCLAISIVVVAGCGGGTRPVKVAGMVTLDGRPLEGGTVTFRPVTEPHETIADSAAKIDAEGKYELQLVDTHQPGAAPGKHQVTIFSAAGGTPLLDDFGRPISDPVPEKYRNGRLEFVVPLEGTTAADFHILSERRPPGR